MATRIYIFNHSRLFFAILAFALLLSACASPTPAPSLTLPGAAISPPPDPSTPVDSLPPVYAAPTPSPFLSRNAVDSPTPAPAISSAVASTTAPTSIQPTPGAAQMGRDSWLSLSPDGAWQAEIEVAFPAPTGEETPSASPLAPQYYSRLVIRHASGSPAWTVVDEWRPWGLGAATPQVFFWSPKGDFVLVVDSATPDGCSPFPYLSRIRRVDLLSGAVQTWSQELQGVLAITPAGDILVLFENPAPSLRLVDVNSGPMHIARAERQIPYIAAPDPGDWQAGGARWDPSGKLLAFTAYPAGCPPELTYIFTLDPLTGDVEPILDGVPGWLDITDWTDLGLVLGDRGGSRWLLNPDADTLTPLP